MHTNLTERQSTPSHRLNILAELSMTLLKLLGGSQMFVTHEGYAIPLHVCNGLYYMDMQPASNSSLTTYPHVFIMADSPWNPDIVDEEFFLDSIDSLVNLPIIQQHRNGCDPLIDMYG